MATVKRCSGCEQEKEASEFQKNRSSKDGLQDQCKACRKITDRRMYLKRSPEQIARFREWNERAIKRNIRSTYENLLEHPCVDCGERDPVVLEFDHINGDKRGNIANLTRSGRSWKKIHAEIEKCEVRCANCHRRATAKRLGSWRYIWNQDSLPT